MREADGVVTFKEWLPDVAPLDNPGLTEALNARPIDGVYKSYPPLSGAYGTLGSVPNESVAVLSPSGGTIVYAGENTRLSASTLGAFTNLSSATYGATWDFELFDNQVFAADINTVIVGHTIGSASNFTTAGSASGTAPSASCLGRVNRFLMAGNINVASNGRNRVRWSAIDSPRSWPTPLSSTATATQAGEQILEDFGGVKAISSGDQYSLIIQSGGIARATYVGPPVVFQFDVISREIGTTFGRSLVQVGGILYFASPRGFYATDGVRVEAIGAGKVDRYFLTRVDTGREREVSVGVDWTQKLIYWAWPSTTATAGQCDNIFFFNYEEKRWGRSNQSTSGMIRVLQDVGGQTPLFGFTTSFVYGQFTGTPGTSQITTGDAEWSRGAFARVQGIKPLVDTSSVTVALASRDSLPAAVGFSSEVTANSRSGFSDFRAEARYHRARLTMTGTYNAAQGLEFQVEPSGPV